MPIEKVDMGRKDSWTKGGKVSLVKVVLSQESLRTVGPGKQGPCRTQDKKLETSCEALL